MHHGYVQGNKRKEGINKSECDIRSMESSGTEFFCFYLAAPRTPGCETWMVTHAMHNEGQMLGCHLHIVFPWFLLVFYSGRTKYHYCTLPIPRLLTQCSMWRGFFINATANYHICRSKCFSLSSILKSGEVVKHHVLPTIHNANISTSV